MREEGGERREGEGGREEVEGEMTDLVAGSCDYFLFHCLSSLRIPTHKVHSSSCRMSESLSKLIAPISCKTHGQSLPFFASSVAIIFPIPLFAPVIMNEQLSVMKTVLKMNYGSPETEYKHC